MKHHYIKNVVNLKLNRTKCRGCELCTEVCPQQILIMKNGKAFIEDRDRCIECGACAKNCPFGAIEVKPGVG